MSFSTAELCMVETSHWKVCTKVLCFSVRTCVQMHPSPIIPRLPYNVYLLLICNLRICILQVQFTSQKSQNSYYSVDCITLLNMTKWLVVGIRFPYITYSYNYMDCTCHYLNEGTTPNWDSYNILLLIYSCCYSAPSLSLGAGSLQPLTQPSPPHCSSSVARWLRVCHIWLVSPLSTETLLQGTSCWTKNSTARWGYSGKKRRSC